MSKKGNWFEDDAFLGALFSLVIVGGLLFLFKKVTYSLLFLTLLFYCFCEFIGIAIKKRNRHNKCFMCGKIKFGRNSGKYAEINYPDKKYDRKVLAIEFVCNKCVYMNDKEDIINRLKKDEVVSVYDLERMGIFKKLEGHLSR